MSEEQLDAQWVLGSHSVGFSASAKAARVTVLGATVDIGKEAGFVVSIEEVQKAQAELSNVELSDEDQDNVAGGLHLCA